MARRIAACVGLLLATAVALVALTASAASAHVVPTSTVQLEVGTSSIAADVAIPVTDVESATGLDLGDGSQADIDAETAAIDAYLLAHVTPTSDDGTAWTVTDGDLVVETTGDPATTGRYQVLETTLTLTPPTSTVPRSFDLGYDAIVDKVATHVVIVTVRTDAADDSSTGAYELGAIRRSTVTNTVEPLHVDLASHPTYAGLTAMLGVGMQHIAEGTDHQLFLLTLLLPAPLLATSVTAGSGRARRWAGPVGARTAVGRIATITVSFTLGHSVTLALGALGLPVPRGLVEAAIAVSILVAAAHAIRPVFPGREALVAAAFGLVHGLAFSETLRALDLGGLRLVSALLGFNLGIEAMQLIVVALVLPPLILLARTRTRAYPALRTTAAGITAVAALGWLGARLGHPNPVADLADRLGTVGPPVIVLLWLVAGATLVAGRRGTTGSPVSPSLPAHQPAHPSCPLQRQRPHDQPTEVDAHPADTQAATPDPTHPVHGRTVPGGRGRRPAPSAATETSCPASRLATGVPCLASPRPGASRPSPASRP